jgi:predicted RecA/RadA family phage recombinase
MRNFVHGDDRITITAAGTLASGAGVLFGQLFGVTLGAATAGQSVTLVLRGVVTLKKAAGSIGAGVLLYWDNTNGRATTTASGNRPIGFHADLVANAGDADAPITVLLAPAPIVTPA